MKPIFKNFQPIDQKILKELGPSGEGDPTEIQRLIDEVYIVYRILCFFVSLGCPYILFI